MSVAGVLQRNDGASPRVRRRDAVLLVLGLLSAVAAVWLCTRYDRGPVTPAEPEAHVLAAAFSVLVPQVRQGDPERAERVAVLVSRDQERFSTT